MSLFFNPNKPKMIVVDDNHPKLEGRHDARAWWPNKIYIKRSHQYDVPLIEHEKTHLRQMWRGLSWTLYQINKNIRYDMEQEAYLVQIEYSLREYMKSHPGLTRNEYRQYADEKARTYAGYLQRNYGLDAGTDERFLKDYDRWYLSHLHPWIVSQVGEDPVRHNPTPPKNPSNPEPPKNKYEF